MENLDPVGVHTGDSIVVAPIQTLTNDEINLLRQASVKVVRALGIIGACNVQLAFDPKTKKYVVIEVNPRVSRSSALASKATGYPSAKIATKLSVGYALEELTYERVQQTLADFEPVFDYVVVKFPCWPFDKFTTADRRLGTQMKATGEVMAIEKTIAAGLQKAIRSLNLSLNGLSLQSLQHLDTDRLRKIVTQIDDRRFFAIIELIKRGITLESIHQATKIALYFLECIASHVKLENDAKQVTVDTVIDLQLLNLKQSGFTNYSLARLWNCSTKDIDAKLKEFSITLHYDKIHAYSPKKNEQAAYYYAVWEKENKPILPHSKRDKVLIIGSGPIRIGQGVEFDYCSVQGVKSLQRAGIETILINNNLAMVSTDYEMADKLYFEPITAEDVLHVIQYEQIEKIIVQFGGQTAINLVKELEDAGVKLLGSSMNTIDILEDRDRFYQYLQSIDIPHIPGEMIFSANEIFAKAEEIGYPILIRPSYVIG